MAKENKSPMPYEVSHTKNNKGEQGHENSWRAIYGGNKTPGEGSMAELVSRPNWFYFQVFTLIDL